MFLFFQHEMSTEDQLLKFRTKFCKISAEIEEQVSRLASPNERILNHQRKMLHQVSIATAETSLWTTESEMNCETSDQCRRQSTNTHVQECIRNAIIHNMNSSNSASGEEVSITAADDVWKRQSAMEAETSASSAELSSIHYSPPHPLPRVRTLQCEVVGEKSLSEMSRISSSSLEVMRRTIQQHADDGCRPVSPGPQHSTPTRIPQHSTPTRIPQHSTPTRIPVLQQSTPIQHGPQTSTPTNQIRMTRSPGTPQSTPRRFVKSKRLHPSAYFSNPHSQMNTTDAPAEESLLTPTNKRLHASNYFPSPQRQKLRMKPSPLCNNINLSYFVDSELENENKEVLHEHQESSEEEVDQQPCQMTATKSQPNIRTQPIQNVHPKQVSTGCLMNATYVVTNKDTKSIPRLSSIREIQGTSNPELSRDSSEDMTLTDLLSRPDCEGKDSTLRNPFQPPSRDDTTFLPDLLSSTQSDAASFMQKPMYHRAITSGTKPDRRKVIAKQLRKMGRKIRNGGQDFMTLAVL